MTMTKLYYNSSFVLMAYYLKEDSNGIKMLYPKPKITTPKFMRLIFKGGRTEEIYDPFDQLIKSRHNS